MAGYSTHGAVGRLRSSVEHLISDPKTLAAAARLLLDLHFTPILADLICAAVDLDVPTLDVAGSGGAAQVQLVSARGGAVSPKKSCAHTPTSARCAALTGRSADIPSALEAAHVRWHSQEATHGVANALALCALHHALFDLGVL